MASLVQYSLLGTVLSRPCTLSWPNYSTMQVIHVNWLRHLPADLAPLPRPYMTLKGPAWKCLSWWHQQQPICDCAPAAAPAAAPRISERYFQKLAELIQMECFPFCTEDFPPSPETVPLWLYIPSNVFHDKHAPCTTSSHLCPFGLQSLAAFHPEAAHLEMQ